ncbi:MAG TPA: AAA family ATPase [Candidatus Limnocylindrales bacterium]|nr:AAA family ATPase [Candidatus Limnocylindrales bacterium]
MADGVARRSFIGRGAELARLRDAVGATAESGNGRTVVVGGEAGIGKSRLIERFAEDTGDARFLIGACLKVAEDALPYAPFVEILRVVIRETPEPLLPTLLGPGRAELTRLLPELAVRASDVQPEVDGGRVSQARLFELVLGVLDRLAAERPLVLAIEDIHWADRSTRDLVGFLSRAMRDDPVLLILTTRTDASGEAVGNLGFLAELEREAHVERLDVPRFDRDEVLEQATSLLDEPPMPGLIDRLVSRTDGNPFYVEELVLASGADGATLPPVLRDVLAARVAGLSGPAREILRAAAAAGRRIDDELLAETLDIAPRDLASGLREALESGILARVETPSGRVSEFRHALLQEVVNDELFPVERAALHAAFGEALERRLAEGDRSVAPVEIARHWDAAGASARALPFMVDAAAAAESVYAFAEAKRLWERAAELLESGDTVASRGRDLPEVLNRAADCSMLVGDAKRAADLLQRALVHVYPSGDTWRVHVLESRFRWHLWWAGRRADTIAAIEGAVARLDKEPAMARAGVLAQLAAVRLMVGDFRASERAAREAIAIAESAGQAADIALAYGALGSSLAMLGDVDGGLAEYRKAQEIAAATGSVEGMGVAATNLASLLDRLGRSAESLEAAEAGYLVTERFGVARTFGAVLLGYKAKAEFALGRWDDADRSTAMGLRRGAIDVGAEWLAINRARLLIGRGAFEEATALLRRARATEDRLGGTEHATSLLAAEAELAVWTGDVVEVLRLGQMALGSLDAGAPPDPAIAWLAALVVRAITDARDAVGPAGQEVVAQINAVRVAAEGSGWAGGDRAAALMAQLGAELLRFEGQAGPAVWSDVAARWGALSRPFRVAYARFREAEAILASRGDRPAAAAALAEAATTAAALGATPLGRLLAGLARQAGIALPDGIPTGQAGADRAPTAHGEALTSREAEVLRLVAAGWTNQQIADELFITRKTASVHVSNIMSKLGAANRGEAAAVAHRLGLAGDVPIPTTRG